MADHAAQRDAAVHVHVGDGGFEVGAADIVVVEIDALGAVMSEGGWEVIDGPVVESGVEAGLAGEPGDLCLAAGAADDAAAFDLGDLADDGADGAGGGGDKDGLPGFGAADVEEADIGGHARHTEGADIGL